MSGLAFVSCPAACAFWNLGPALDHDKLRRRQKYVAVLSFKPEFPSLHIEILTAINHTKAYRA
jgi:hypothetical protein